MEVKQNMDIRPDPLVSLGLQLNKSLLGRDIDGLLKSLVTYMNETGLSVSKEVVASIPLDE